MEWIKDILIAIVAKMYGWQIMLVLIVAIAVFAFAPTHELLAKLKSRLSQAGKR